MWTRSWTAGLRRPSSRHPQYPAPGNTPEELADPRTGLCLRQVADKPAIRRSACDVVHGSQVSEMPTNQPCANFRGGESAASPLFISFGKLGIAEAVADIVIREQICGMSGIILQFPAQLTDIRSQVLSFTAVFRTPDK